MLSDGAVLVGEQQCLQVNHLFAKLTDLRGKGVVLVTINLNFVLKVGKPLLLSLATLEGGNSKEVVR